jgi:putative flippase GtrA
MREPRELAAALPVSAAAFALDVAVLYGLVRFCGWHYLPAASVSFTLGVALNYALSVRYVFSYRRLGSRVHEFAIFALVGLAGLVLNAAVLAFFVEVLRQHYLVGKVVAAGATFLVNFGARRLLLFTPPGKRPPWTVKA